MLLPFSLGVIALALPTWAAPSLETTNVRRAARNYCQPGMPCWPSAADWGAFNNTLGGRLIEVRPWPEPCFGQPRPNAAQCQAVQSQYTNNGPARADQPGWAEIDNWTYCYDGQTESDCTINADVPQLSVLAPLRTCGMGRISPYAVNVGSAADVRQAIAFAKKRNIKIVIKNTGHDYLGRSTSRNSLLIWTHNLRKLQYVDNYKDQGNAVVMGAGTYATDAYDFANKYGKSITLGAVGTVGVAGGFAMGGGHGPLGPKRGLAVDNILEYEITTADGKTRRVNSGSEPDLFWALRGGGGGSWGVVTETVIRVFPDEPFVALRYLVSTTGAGANQDKALAGVVAKWAELQEGWTKAGIAAYQFIYRDAIIASMGMPTGDVAAAHAQMDPLIDYFRSVPGFVVGSAEYTRHNTLNDYRNTFKPDSDFITPIATSQRLASRLIPTDAFSTPANRAKLGTDVIAAWRTTMDNIPAAVAQTIRPVALQVYSTGALPSALGGPSGKDTGVNPAWRNSFWEVVVASGWTTPTPQSSRTAIADAVHRGGDVLRQYGTGTYVNEADTLEQDWQTAFFGSNYARLLSIKRRYDPEGRFIVWKGVGFDGNEQEQSFQCYNNA